MAALRDAYVLTHCAGGITAAIGCGAGIVPTRASIGELEHRGGSKNQQA
jgi:hypothetical protein